MSKGHRLMARKTPTMSSNSATSARVAVIDAGRRGFSTALWPGLWLAAVIAFVAFFLSFQALRMVAIAAGLDGGSAWMYPIIIDGFILLASWAAWRFRDGQIRASWYPWLALVLFAGISLVGNALHAQPRQVGPLLLSEWAAAAFSSVPPTALLMATHILVIIATKRAEDTAAAQASALEGRASSAEKEAAELRTQVARLATDNATAARALEAARAGALPSAQPRSSQADSSRPADAGVEPDPRPGDTDAGATSHRAPSGGGPASGGVPADRPASTRSAVSEPVPVTPTGARVPAAGPVGSWRGAAAPAFPAPGRVPSTQPEAVGELSPRPRLHLVTPAVPEPAPTPAPSTPEPEQAQPAPTTAPGKAGALPTAPDKRPAGRDDTDAVVAWVRTQVAAKTKPTGPAFAAAFGVSPATARRRLAAARAADPSAFGEG